MRVHYLKQLLSMYPDDMEIFIQTIPADLCSPLDFQHITQSKAYTDERYGLQHAKLILTAYHPDRETTLPQEKGLKAAREVFDLLYPVLTDDQKKTTEAGKACERVCVPNHH